MDRNSGAGKAGIVRRRRTGAQARGEAAESLAEAHLARHGVRTLERRLRCRGGEIDLICLDRDVLVFVEVRLRTPGHFGSAADSITATKQSRVVLAARWWLSGAGRMHASRAMRFDAVLLERLDDRSIDWIRGAFSAEGS